MRGHPTPSTDHGPASRAIPHPALRRRGLLGGAGVAIGAALAVPGGAPLAPAAAQPPGTEPPIRPLDSAMHRRALEVRQSCARLASEVPVAPHPANDDEARYPNRIGTDTRALPHDARGEVDPAAWRALFEACQSGEPADFERIPLGGTRRLGNPVGTMAVSLSGVTPTQIAIPAAPSLASAERAAEAVEVYWQALLRDVPFSEYRDGTDHPDILAAAGELDRLPGLRGKPSGRVTPGTMLRGAALYFDPADPKGRVAIPPGVPDGPMISQFLLRDIPFGAQWISARMRTVAPENFLTEYDEWLRVQNGQPPRGRLRFDPEPRYISTGRDLAEMARQGPVLAWAVALYLLSTPSQTADPRYGGMFPLAQPALSPTNPYRHTRNQSAGAASFGLQHIQVLLSEAVNYGPRAAYWQKWFVHRTLRPEAYGGLAHHRLVNGAGDYPLHDDLLQSEAMDRTRAKQGTCLLSQTSPEGAPIFSAYPGGAAALAGAAATVLKAFADESRVIEDPVQPDPRDPTRLVPYVGPPLTVGGELNKMAANFAMGRNWMGIHWWSDSAASLALGEEVALALLREDRMTVREPFEGYTLTCFDGRRVTA